MTIKTIDISNLKVQEVLDLAQILLPSDQLWLIEQLNRLTASTLHQLSNESSLEEFLTKVKATPRNPANFHPAKGSLAEALRHSPHDPDFDLAEWNQAWTVVEAEMKATTQANNVAEGFS